MLCFKGLYCSVIRHDAYLYCGPKSFHYPISITTLPDPEPDPHHPEPNPNANPTNPNPKPGPNPNPNSVGLMNLI